MVRSKITGNGMTKSRNRQPLRKQGINLDLIPEYVFLVIDPAVPDVLSTASPLGLEFVKSNAVMNDFFEFYMSFKDATMLNNDIQEPTGDLKTEENASFLCNNFKSCEITEVTTDGDTYLMHADQMVRDGGDMVTSTFDVSEVVNIKEEEVVTVDLPDLLHIEATQERELTLDCNDTVMVYREMKPAAVKKRVLVRPRKEFKPYSFLSKQFNMNEDRTANLAGFISNVALRKDGMSDPSYVQKKKETLGSPVKFEVIKDTVQKPARVRGIYRCGYCYRRFVTAGGMRDHYVKHFQDHATCPVCEKPIRKSDLTDYHTHCFSRGREVRRRPGRQRKDEAANPGPHICPVCGKKYRSFGSLRQHKKYYHEPQGEGRVMTLCNLCGELVRKKSMWKHVESHSSQLFQCEMCSQHFKSQEKLDWHMAHHRNRADCECPKCGKRFGCNTSKRRHMMRHEEKSVPCPVCGKLHHSMFDVSKHLRESHSKQGYRCCDICGKSVTVRGFKRHMLMHTGEKPFECSRCNKKFRRNFRLKDHCITVHGLSFSSVCQFCRLYFESDELVARHAGSCPKKPTTLRIPCEVCGFLCVTPSIYRTHMRDKHPEDGTKLN